jgi:thiamine biosynthesis lipoprotein
MELSRQTSCARRLALLALLPACAAQVITIEGRTMGTSYSIKYVGPPSSRPSVTAAIESALEAVDALFSTYRADSVVSRFNASRTTEPVAVGREFRDLTAMALSIAAATDGAFDPTILPVVRAYPLRDGRTTAIPSASVLAAAVERVGFDRIEIVDGSTIRKTRADTELDTNAFAKGHGVDRVVGELQRLGYLSCLVEIGGEVRCGGTKPGGAPWVVGVESPVEDGRRVVNERVHVRDEAIATSGSYRQFIESGGATVHHIFDSRTGANPPSDVLAVSVRSATCAVADALATAFMVTGPAGVDRVRASLPSLRFGALFVHRDDAGKIVRRAMDWY